MQKMVDGKLYDTETSLWIHTFEVPPYEGFDPAGNDAVLSETQVLYLSDKRQFFVIVTTSFTNYPDSKTVGQLMSREEAKNWLDETGAPADAYDHAKFKVKRG